MLTGGKEPTYILEVKGQKTGKTALFLKLKHLYPECLFLIMDQPQLYPLFCLKNEFCPRNSQCMSKLAKRVKYIFDSFSNAYLLFLYFSYQDKPGSQRAGIFWDDFREPKFITFNRSTWEKMKKIGTLYEIKIPDSLFFSTSNI